MTAGQFLDDNTESLEEAYYYLLVRQSFLMLTFWWTGYKHAAYLIRTSKICVVHGGVQQKHRAPFSLFIMKNMLADREQRAGSRAGCGRRCQRKWCFRLSPCESTLTPDGSSESRVSLTTTEIYLEAPCFSQGAHTHTHSPKVIGWKSACDLACHLGSPLLLLSTIKQKKKHLHENRAAPQYESVKAALTRWEAPGSHLRPFISVV